MALLPHYPPSQIEPEQRRHFVQDQIRTMLASMRKLMPAAAVLFLLGGVRDLAADSGVAAIQLRLLLFLGLLVLATAFGLARSRGMQAALALLFMAGLSAAITAMAVHDSSRLAYSIAPLVLLPVVTGLLWTRPGHLVAVMLASLLPVPLALMAVDAGRSDWLAFGFYLGVGVITGLMLHWFRMAAAVEYFLLREGLVRAASHDALTGVLNRAGWDASGEAVLARAALEGRPLALAFLDLDHFKRINDLHGHAVGDAVLEAVAAVLRRELRDSDLVARLGGEEFVLMLPGVDRAVAERIVERIREAVAQAATPVPTTLSAGVAERHDGEALEGLMHRADLALLAAKEAGRNQVRFAD